MDTLTIKQCIQNWISIRENATLINEKFEQGNSFKYTRPSYFNPLEETHVYPGISEGDLVFFVIPAEYDSPAYENEIADYTVMCRAGFNVGGGSDHEITEAEAQARMWAWENYHEAWVPLQIATVDGIFEAFSVAGQDFESEEVVMTLGLKQSLEEKQTFLADLVVTNEKKNVYVYDDYVQPVPPFSATALSNSFYLLS